MKRISNLIAAICAVALCIGGGTVLAEPPSAPSGLMVDLVGYPEKTYIGKTQEGAPNITVYRPAKPNGAAVVICPGGGYGAHMLGPEGHEIAQWLNRHGIVGVVLQYRLPRGNPLLPVMDAQRAIRLARSKAKDWGCDPKKIGIMGFSAGGHLAATCATHFDGGDPKASDPVEKLSSRPDFTLLIYPVITMGELTHQGSKENLLGKAAEAKTVEFYSDEKQVTAQTPPSFLAHAKDDKLVSPENSKMFYAALQANKVPSYYLELESGGHGLNGYKGPMWDSWQTESLKWLSEQGIIPKEDAAGKGK